MDRVYRSCREVIATGTSNEIEAALLAAGRDAISVIVAGPGLRAAWWPRFRAIAHWVAEKEVERRAVAKPLATEQRGQWVLEMPGGPFTLTGRADRIDRTSDGTLAIIDYKTGSIPSARWRQAGFAPQLPLLGAMAQAGGFKDIPVTPVSELAFWHLSGGADAGREIPFYGAKDPPIAEAIAEARDGLAQLIAVYDAPTTPYAVYPVPEHEPTYDDYQHLARVREWSAGAPDTGGGES
jgi:ATP-dependent helicase/nuclease subunit B